MDAEIANKPIEVLLIEDDPGDRILTKWMLERGSRSAFVMNFADTLSKGIESASKGPTDIILLDLNLPDSFGLQTFYRIRMQLPEIPIVVLSGFDDEEGALKAVRDGAQDYLTKGRIDSTLLARSLRYAVERKRAAEMVENLAYHDSLTGLSNRALFHERFKMAAAESRRNGTKTSLIMLDLDHFKDVNDKLGHNAGDGLLREVSKRLVDIVRQTDLVCRIGGDEFAILISNVITEDTTEEIARRILVNVGKPFNVDGVEESISASVGISIYPNDGETLETLIKHADTAMYEVKKAGRNNYLFYQPYMSIHRK